MNPRHCLNCKRWDRTSDKAVGYCLLAEEQNPLRRKIRFQFEECDCGGYAHVERCAHVEPSYGRLWNEKKC